MMVFSMIPSIQAWSTIVHLLIPNISQLEASLNSFATVLDADEVLLFEKATFLVSTIADIPISSVHEKDNDVL